MIAGASANVMGFFFFLGGGKGINMIHEKEYSFIIAIKKLSCVTLAVCS